MDIRKYKKIYSELFLFKLTKVLENDDDTSCMAIRIHVYVCVSIVKDESDNAKKGAKSFFKLKGSF